MQTNKTKAYQENIPESPRESNTELRHTMISLPILYVPECAGHDPSIPPCSPQTAKIICSCSLVYQKEYCDLIYQGLDINHELIRSYDVKILTC